jgi:protein tyrosine/serine phosphatase
MALVLALRQASCQAARMQTRVLKLDGVHNFRDYGGYTGAGGARVKPGLLWRSAQHGDASDQDLADMHALGIKTVVDLRGPSERQAKPCRRHPAFDAEVLFHPDETAGLALHTEAADGVITAAEARAAMVRLYQGIPFRENLLYMIRRYFDVLRRAEGPSLVHCVAGKDRTGFAVALAQYALGVSQDDIIADYVLTNQAGNIEARIAAGATQIRARHGSISDDTIRTLMGVEADYITTAFDHVAARYGSLDAYLAQVVGVDAAMRADLHSSYLED